MGQCNMALKTLEESYKVGSDLISIGGWGEKL
jgi:hypothetical protein